MSDAGPVGPVGPVAPATPCSPCGPVGPATPLSPCGPVARATPAGPCGALAPGVRDMLLAAFIALVVPTTKAPLIVMPLLNVALAPLSGAVNSTSRVPVPHISIEFTAPAAHLSAEHLIGYDVFVPAFDRHFGRTIFVLFSAVLPLS